MARRRLLTILAGSAVFSTLVAGPAAALDAAETAEVVVETAEGDGGTTEPVEAVLDDTVVEEPVSEVTEPVEDASELVEEAVEQPATTSSSPEPEPEPEPRTTTSSPGPSAAESADDGSADVVTAGEVVDAPGPDLHGSRGMLWPRSEEAPPAAPAPVTAPPAAGPDEVEAPLVAAPAAVEAPAVTTLAQPATVPLPDEDSPALVLAAVVALLAAGAWTLGEARATGALGATEIA